MISVTELALSVRATGHRRRSGSGLWRCRLGRVRARTSRMVRGFGGLRILKSGPVHTPAHPLLGPGLRLQMPARLGVSPKI